MNYTLLNIVLALTWAMLNGEINPVNLIVGFVIGYLILFTARRALGPSPYFGRVWKAIRFAIYFFGELFRANFKLAYDVLTPHMNLMKPRIISVPLDVTTDAQITALANLISLTPGTLSLDVSSDRRVLYIHFMYAEDADTARREIKNGMERWVRDLSSKEKE
ncbi:MAG: Na+/H+ antiporter subunit E [Anaerolineales bacterium]|nr:MAG: Na+/H+ antiporter subunit E [Anaerolineales bacterium]